MLRFFGIGKKASVYTEDVSKENNSATHADKSEAPPELPPKDQQKQNVAQQQVQLPQQMQQIQKSQIWRSILQASNARNVLPEQQQGDQVVSTLTTSGDKSTEQREVVAIVDDTGRNHYYQKRVIKKNHPQFGTVWQEEYRDLGQSPRTSSTSIVTDKVLLRELKRTPSSLLPVVKHPIYVASQKSVVTASSTSINLLSMSNVSMSFSMSDLFGLGALMNAHFRLMQSMNLFWRVIFVLWELALVSLILWQIVRMLGWMDLAIGLVHRIAQDGIIVAETGAISAWNAVNSIVSFLTGATQFNASPLSQTYSYEPTPIQASAAAADQSIWRRIFF
ncbi:hypothetical protein MP228_009604 [Amoeboaphelidium protococcarum]|nr:hypothetical protein MP228_009604 [Amoeboaphelidium protococcarum]